MIERKCSESEQNRTGISGEEEKEREKESSHPIRIHPWTIEPVQTSGQLDILVLLLSFLQPLRSVWEQLQNIADYDGHLMRMTLIRIMRREEVMRERGDN